MLTLDDTTSRTYSQSSRRRAHVYPVADVGGMRESVPLLGHPQRQVVWEHV